MLDKVFDKEQACKMTESEFCKRYAGNRYLVRNKIDIKEAYKELTKDKKKSNKNKEGDK